MTFTAPSSPPCPPPPTPLRIHQHVTRGLHSQFVTYLRQRYGVKTKTGWLVVNSLVDAKPCYELLPSHRHRDRIFAQAQCVTGMQYVHTWEEAKIGDDTFLSADARKRRFRSRASPFTTGDVCTQWMYACQIRLRMALELQVRRDPEGSAPFPVCVCGSPSADVWYPLPPI
jgi:hypothetical protein